MKTDLIIGDKTNLTSVIKCPKCGFKKKETMPTNFCQIMYKCPNCGETLTPKEGECCIFCSYADKKCPPKQIEEKSD